MTLENFKIQGIKCPIIRFTLNSMPAKYIIAKAQKYGYFNNYKRFHFNEETVSLITGGANGLGSEIVKLLLTKPSRKIIVVDVVPPIPEYLNNPNILFLKCDISDEGQVKRLYEKVIADFGYISILINNAGKTTIETIFTTEDNQIDSVININFLGAYYLTTLFLPHLLEKMSGCIVNVSSILGETTPARLSTYGASKATLTAFHRLLTDHIAKIPCCHVNTVLVCPGKLETKMFEVVSTPSKVLAPDVDPTKLSLDIINAIESNNSSIIRRPYYTNLLPVYNSLDWPFVWMIKHMSGMNKVTAL
ncbi:similar to Saccharomyces cerevisiae YDL114W Putative protein of unknown function with similarity to acyl-carrier-protein reductases [Maudiozyma barnettii]|uniref:Uncharacterized protein n=1 Tax=Maudiozyma barnettii TaxID=61262 RepID=A0A8H2ZIL5_9SACH|nr:short-chain dehydrogenase/reductase [Kazachstania barnettii]CAB4257064.1 similar to Saccharomyces cerevisiae YDL114W Putative protein of unknown function with similarity to acyl-carrier-protein reductases [Kazachstania barnettii]CAD1779435.1 similar to Saccharomyces cerevisiae YDL114W Putative protein of unknown function with similarity to acyl-carrier-protein reductases [Kazachstania barnettii]